MKPEPSHDKDFYIIGWACILFVLIYIGLRAAYNIDLVNVVPPCLLNVATGLYCPGCGGTRAMFALARGDFFRALYLHPFVPYAVIVGGWFMISQTIEMLSRGRLKIGLHFRMIYLWIGLALVAINFLWKNGVFLVTGESLI